MTSRDVINAGYTLQLELHNHEYFMCVLTNPGADLDGKFRAWDIDEQEWIVVNGWEFEIEILGQFMG